MSSKHVRERKHTHNTISVQHTPVFKSTKIYRVSKREREREKEKYVSASECSSQNDHIQISKEMFTSMGLVHKLSRLYTLFVCLHGQHAYQSYLV